MWKETKDLYEKKGFAQRSGFGKSPAIIVVDVITGFTDPDCDLGSNYDELIGNLQKVLQTARERKIPIIFTTVVYEHPAEGGQFIKKVPALKVLAPDSQWIQVDPRLERQTDETVLVKKFASAFFGTSLGSMLTSCNVDTVVVTGVTTSGCVRATAVDALQFGYKVVVPKECVGDRARGPHEASLFDIHAKYGDVIGVEELLSYLRDI